MSEDLPIEKIRSLQLTGHVLCMDFHPYQEYLLLVGLNDGVIVFCDLRAQDEHIMDRNMHIFCLITCGGDGRIKIWDAATGKPNFWSSPRVFCQDEKSILTVYLSSKKNIEYIYSTDECGRFTAWQRGELFVKKFYQPFKSSTRMAWSADGNRCFLSGKESVGETSIIMWDATAGTLERKYEGLEKLSSDYAHFDTAKNRFLAAGFHSEILFWNMDSDNVLERFDLGQTIDCIRFSKQGTLLAVSCIDEINILANAAGILMTEKFGLEGYTRDSVEVAVGSEERIIWKRTKACNLILPDCDLWKRVVGLQYTNEGDAILALFGDGMHRKWKLKKIFGQILLEKAPNFVQRETERSRRITEAVPFLSFSQDDCFAVSSIGQSVYLLDMMKSEIEMTYLEGGGATAAAFNPVKCFIIAIGDRNALINIFNFYDKRRKELDGHKSRITGLSFSNDGKFLISSGDNGQLYSRTFTSGTVTNKVEKLMVNHEESDGHRPIFVRFVKDGYNVLAFDSKTVAIYNEDLKVQGMWTPPSESLGSIEHSAFSCDGKMVFIAFSCGIVGVLKSVESEWSMKLTNLIDPSDFIFYSSRGKRPVGASGLRPLVITSHPSFPKQFAVGLSDGRVFIVEEEAVSEEWGERTVDF